MRIIYKYLWTSVPLPVTVSAFLFILFAGCYIPDTKVSKTIVLQPYQDFPLPAADSVLKSIKEIYPQTFIAKPIPLPPSAFYMPRKRYRAIVLISELRDRFGEDTVVIGLTTKDISCTKGSIKDYGIMGLGFRPGSACVVSWFRLSKANGYSQFYKVVLHELGHTQGLPHCPQPACLMRDANGGNPIDEETGFCAKCTTFLKGKGLGL